jgi:DNA primase large subunit
MIRSEYARVDPKRRNVLDPKKKQFAQAVWQQQEYKHRLNFYTLPPTAEISLEQFEEWAINRLKGRSISFNLKERVERVSPPCRYWKY